MNNSFGEYFKVTTFGESHGEAIGVVVDGVPAGITLTLADIMPYLQRRKPGTNPYTTPRKEADDIEILSGIFENKTLGTPIAIIIKNIDKRSEDYGEIKNIFRPNHGDFSWQQKFGFRDYRGGGRSSARETAARVIAGAIAAKIVRALKIEIYGALVQIGTLPINYQNWDYTFINQNLFSSPDKNIISAWEKLITELKAAGDSIGAKIELHIKNVPAGLGEPVFDKLDASLAKAIMSIPAVKSVEIGIGAEAVLKKGSEIADEITVKNQKVNFEHNYSGGIQGGISNGNDIVVRFVVKPTSSINIAKNTITNDFKNTTISTTGRHDPCVGLRAVVIAEAMAAITLADFILRHRARYNFIANPSIK